MCNPEVPKKVRRRLGSQFRKRTRVGILWSSKVYKNFWVYKRTVLDTVNYENLLLNHIVDRYVSFLCHFFQFILCFVPKKYLIWNRKYFEFLLHSLTWPNLHSGNYRRKVGKLQKKCPVILPFQISCNLWYINVILHIHTSQTYQIAMYKFIHTWFRKFYDTIFLTFFDLQPVRRRVNIFSNMSLVFLE